MLAPQLAANSLGLLVFRLANEMLPHVFVSVDQQANLLLRIGQRPTPDGQLAVDNESLLTGIAYDSAGRAQACMGIAAGDITSDGEIDLLVTNFYLEYNTLYLQRNGLFEDATGRSGTQAETTNMLGFGAQFLDCQLDGFQDLIVLNGHIDDHTHVGVAEQMPAQLFVGMPGPRFTDVPAEKAGGFFAEPRLGRALAKTDLNRDGLTDVVCTDLESPTAILLNRSQTEGNSLTLRLVGVQSDRNAIGTVARLSGENYLQTLQLTGGSGYQASNERMLSFSLPHGAGGLALEITWPSGAIDTYEIPAAQSNRRFTAIENQGITLEQP